jgi:hypothetical protein
VDEDSSFIISKLATNRILEVELNKEGSGGLFVGLKAS